MVEDNMGKFKSHISGFQSEGEFLFGRMCILRSENIAATPDPLLSLALLKDEQRLNLEEFVDGSYHPS